MLYIFKYIITSCVGIDIAFSLECIEGYGLDISPLPRISSWKSVNCSSLEQEESCIRIEGVAMDLGVSGDFVVGGCFGIRDCHNSCSSIVITLLKSGEDAHAFEDFHISECHHICCNQGNCNKVEMNRRGEERKQLSKISTSSLPTANQGTCCGCPTLSTKMLPLVTVLTAMLFVIYIEEL